jgi:N4-(beta-N-acetylglucosaminyl)-L-asparaginase
MTASGIGAVVSPTVATLAQTPQLLTKRIPKPVVVASGNGNKSRDAAGLACVAKAFQSMTSGADLLNALIEGVNIIELDPDDDSVGYGGLPNAEGVVQLPTGHGEASMLSLGSFLIVEAMRNGCRPRTPG